MKAPPLPISSALGQSPPATGWKGPARRVLAVCLAGFVLLLACSRQEEGDRCSLENDDNDCESGLICINPDDLRGGKDEVPRCCPPDGEPISNGRCTRLIGGGGGSGGGPSGGGQAGESNASTTVGAACTHTSQCAEGMVCGPQGLCQPECLEDRDCIAPKVCSDDGRCITL